MKKAIIMDMDGTLFTSDKSKNTISPHTKAELLRVQAAGARLVLASGRPAPGLMPIAKELEMDKHDGLIVAFNGAQAIDCQTGKLLFTAGIDPALGQRVLRHLEKFDVKPMIAKDDYMYVTDVYDNIIHPDGKPLNVYDYEAHGNNYKLCETDSLAGFLDFPLFKILTAAEPDYLAAHYEEMSAPFASELNAMFTASFYYEFTARGIDKGSTLQAFLPQLGYAKDDMYAFGDGENDISMIRYAGHGIAMANAVTALKECADEITLSNDEDGIAKILERLQ
jgi:Cof subfamily protein (haloacid dehalogenase superfamily)